MRESSPHFALWDGYVEIFCLIKVMRLGSQQRRKFEFIREKFRNDSPPDPDFLQFKSVGSFGESGDRLLSIKI